VKALPLFLQFVLALLIAAACIRPLARLAPRLGLTDAPGPRKVHVTPIPRVGGIAMAIGILVPILLTHAVTGPLAGFLAGAATLLVFGVWDDRSDLGYRAKFAGQVMAVLLCMWLGDVRIETLTLDQRLELPPFLSYGLTFLFLVGVTNAVNLSDGLDGLAGGMALLCLCAIALLAAVSGNVPVVAVSLIECGAILGFLRFNTHPAQIFMGDCGSQLLGFSIGVLAILATQGESTSVSAALPLLLLGLPILDTVSVMTQRIAAGRSPFSSDRNHFHHKLLGLGFAHSEAVIVVYLLQAALFLVAYTLRFESDLTIVAAFIGFAGVALGALRWASVSGWKAHADGGDSWLARAGTRLRAATPPALARASLWAVGLGIAAYAAATVVSAREIGGDLGILGAILLIALAVCATPRAARFVWLERAIAYVAIVLIVYLDQTSPHAAAGWNTLSWLLVGGIAVAAVLRFVVTGARAFQITALDILVAFVALIVPMLPGPGALPEALTGGIAKTMILLYAVELLLAGELRLPVPRAILALTFSAIALRGLLQFLP
jgi:UDP-GlcNAc:undecaprenyl-phosphate/decaprenyl-phosphate GlcNAc-1-phosphate transferase